MSAKELLDPSSGGIRSQGNALLDHNVSVCIENFRELITQSDACNKNVLEWINKLENKEKVITLLLEKKDITDLGNEGLESRPDEGDEGAKSGI